MAIHLHRNDLPADIRFDGAVAVDSETLGLNPLRDRLCVVQLSAGDGDAHLVTFDAGAYDAPHLKAVLSDPQLLKIFHFARFDVAVFKHWLGVDTTPIYCTKIASKLARTYTDRHGLKDVVREMTGVELSKQQQSSDWAAAELTEAQRAYAASDVLHLHAVREGLDRMIDREGRRALLTAAFAFLPTRAALDLAGWSETDIFAHS
ncbi:hypothetical protein PB2503_06342 [Parvularcula bermudensis HTCC2503]|uniref:3'-5' exonuclease domain-containing protein n=1 Tax=Parvularcula bermudensis (strain ATCC BAA-594 / HTCC2503 / KCTC 12087) TaxID=314260 RepID=E0THN8_PARBH|nr:ribonuclease D [Parvularcula bermudensis]ADM09334.1 hypothetical protein PB2503_06342 [Parvularcula bermudensis HTCC2503]